ncbi:hypothetical protein B0H11DRAFT_1847791 [Mycena galericulata]|nr:hypothetical protein B0H11DRAFT_1847791 [Mycena galericulata]
MSGGKCGALCCADSEPHVSLRASPNCDHLFSSNAAPLDSEIPLIRQIVVESQAYVDALNFRIQALRATMDELIAKREKVVDHIQLHNAVLSPIRRVPPEIVCEIFTWMPESTRMMDDTPVKQPSWWLGHICRSWREIALADSRLWRSFTIFQSPEYPHEVAYPQSMIQTQLLWSANSPLAIEFDWDQAETFGNSPVLDTLLACSNRWGSIRVRCHCDTSRTILDVLSGLKGQFSQLQTLEFIIDGDPEYPSQQWDIFSIAPRLSNVLLTNSVVGQYSPNFLIPWQQITRYRGVFSLARHLDIFQDSPNLVECGIGFDELNGVHGDVMVTLPHLGRLFAEKSVILSHLIIPPLAELFTEGAVDPLLPFVHRSSCRLTTLVLTSCSSSEGLIPVLEASPSLQLLHFDDGLAEAHTAGVLFTAMTVFGTSRDILPNLTSFAYGTDARRLDTSTYDSLFHMIRSRLQPELAYRLLFVRLYSISDLQEPMLAGIRTLTDASLDVKFLDWMEWRMLTSKNRP